MHIRNSFIHVESEGNQRRLPRFSMPAKLSQLKTDAEPTEGLESSRLRKEDAVSESSGCSTKAPSFGWCRGASATPADKVDSETESMCDFDDDSDASEPRLRTAAPTCRLGGMDALRAACARAAKAVENEDCKVSRCSLSTVDRVSDVSVQTLSTSTERSSDVSTGLQNSELPDSRLSDPWAMADLRQAAARPQQQERASSPTSAAVPAETVTEHTHHAAAQAEFPRHLLLPDPRLSDPWALSEMRRVKADPPVAPISAHAGSAAAPFAAPPNAAFSSAGLQALPYQMPWPHAAMQPHFPTADTESAAMLAAVHAGFSAGAVSVMQNMGHAFMLAAATQQQQQQLQRVQQQYSAPQQQHAQPRSQKALVPQQTTPPVSPSAQATAVPKRTKKVKPPPPCKWFARGTCKFENCRFPHVLVDTPPDEVPQNTEVEQPFERLVTPEPSYCQLVDSNVQPEPTASRESSASLLSEEPSTENRHCQLIWCDQRAFKELPETASLKLTLEARTGLTLRSHKTAEMCIRLLQKKQQWRERRPQPLRVFLVSWPNAPVLVPYLNQCFGSCSKVVVVCDSCRSKALESARSWARQFPIITQVAASWEEAIDAASDAVQAAPVL